MAISSDSADYRNTQTSGLIELRAGIVAGYHKIGLLADRRGHLPTCRLDLLFGDFSRPVGQRSGEHESEAFKAPIASRNYCVFKR